MALAGLDEHIAGGRYYEYQEDVKCPQCGHVWEITIASDYGQNGPTEDPLLCPECGEVIDI